MIAFVFTLAMQTPFVAKGADMSWSFPGTSKSGQGRVDLIGKDLRGEVLWFVSKSGRYDAETLYQKDTQRTKEADATKGFIHVRTLTTFAGMPAIASDQRYLWNEAPVLSRCVYCAAENRAWVVRLWWPRNQAAGSSAATSFLKTVRREGANGKGKR